MTWIELLREKLHGGSYVGDYDNDIPFLCPADMFCKNAPLWSNACKAKSCKACWNSEAEVEK